MPVRRFLLDATPLRKHRDFRLLFIGQWVSAIGSFVTYVALPVQVYQLTKSSTAVGLVGVVQLIPLVATALWGEAVADAIDRRRLLLGSEALLLLGSLALMGNALLPQPSVAALFVIAAFLSAVNGFHTPALQAMTPRLVGADDQASVAALMSLRGTSAAIVGPALAGVCIAAFGVPVTYAIDAATFLVSLVAIAQIRAMPPGEGAPRIGLASVLEGLRYAAARPVLIGTYAVDIIAMTFAMPMAVFPALGERYGGANAAGYLFAALSVGSLLMTLTSGWSKHVQRQGAAVLVSAAIWGMAIVGLGFAGSLLAALLWLALAGAADMASGVFRMTIWNETIPTELRGRLAGIEQLSYMSGPLLGNARAGLMAERIGLMPSIAWGGLLCVGGMAACRLALPQFWHFRKR
jgi:MFS family permease